MQYLILIYGDEKVNEGISEADMQKEFAHWMQYSKEMAESGVMLGGASLKPISTATTVRVRGGKVSTTDGPFAETKEQLGGYYVINVPTLDEAIKWASKCPGALLGSMEVRPLGIISDATGAVVAMQ